MKLDDLVVAWVTSLLAKERTHWPEILTRLEALLGASWSLRRLAQPSARSRWPPSTRSEPPGEHGGRSQWQWTRLLGMFVLHEDVPLHQP